MPEVGDDRALAICETAADVDAAIGLGGPGAPVPIVALSAAAWLQGTRRGASVAILEDFYSETELCERRYPLLTIQLAWMDWLDHSLADAVPELKRVNLKLSRLWFYCLKRLIDPLAVLDFTLGSLLDAQKPSAIWLPPEREMETVWAHFFRAGPHGRMETPHFSPATVVPILAAPSHAEIRRLPVPQASRSGGATALQRRGVRPFLRRHLPPWIIDRARAGRTFSPKEILRTLPGFRGGGQRLLVVRGGYDLDPLIGECLRRGARPEFWSALEPRTAMSASEAQLCKDIEIGCAKAWPDLESDPAIQRPFELPHGNLFDLARPGLEHFVAHTVAETVLLYLRARSAIRSRGYRALLAPAGIRATALLEAARAEHVPVVIYQHGGFVGTCEHLMWDFTDFGNADAFIVYGEGVRRYFDRRRSCPPRTGGRIFVAGSARLEQRMHDTTSAEIARVKAVLAAPGRRAAVLYASTLTSEYSRLVAGESYPETLCFRRQAAAIDLMKQYGDVSFIFKPYSDRDDTLFRDLIARSGATNCRVISDIPLFTLMQAADAVLVEFPSTALLEAATTRKPIVAYVDRESLRLEGEAREILGRRAVIAETHGAFLEAIRTLVENGPLGDQADLDEGYATEFVLDRSKGPSASRAWEAVREVAGLPA